MTTQKLTDNTLPNPSDTTDSRVGKIVADIYNGIIILLLTVLKSLFFIVLFIVMMNLIPGQFSYLREWIEQYFLYISIFALVILIANWRKLMPTVRTVAIIERLDLKSNFSSRLKSRVRIYITLLISVGLFIFASLAELPIWDAVNQHPVRYGYAANTLLAVSLLMIIADFTSPKEASINTSAFVPDNPDGELKPTESQLQAIDHLANIFISGMPRSVTLNGDWGSGKTLVYRKARSETSLFAKDIIWVEFNPWQYASEEALIKGFYETIAKNIDEEIPGLQNALVKVTKSVEQLVRKSGNESLFQVLGNLLKDLSSTSQTPDEIIKGMMDREGKRLIIVLDDIERQYDSERTFRALQLVHHAKTMGERNVQVLCIFERDALLNAVPLHIPNSQEYLEKFSEIEINVPPPTVNSLRAHLESLISHETYGINLPKDFKLDIDYAGIRDMKSHRGIIRAFNELLLDFSNTQRRKYRLTAQERGKSDEIITYVDYTDRFLMGHIKLKYPFLYRDIAANRALYTTSKEGEDDFKFQLLDDNEAKKKDLDHFNLLFEKQNFSVEQAETVKGLIVSLFPATYRILESYNKQFDEAELRNNRKVGHRDVLDAYFALTASQDAYSLHKEWIDELIKGIDKLGDKRLIKRFITYMQRAEADKSDIDSITLLRNELLKTRHHTYQLRVFRAWLRAILSYKADDKSFDKNRFIGRVLSAINDIVMRDSQDNRIHLGRYVFEEITSYLNNPYDALLILLFLLPDRQNYFLSDYVSHGGFDGRGVYNRVLKWVDNYITPKKINIFKEYSHEDWSFIIYQWGFSISTGGTLVNKRVNGATDRLNRVNDYVFKVLSADDRLAKSVLTRKFWREDNLSIEGATKDWRVDTETLGPLKPDVLKSLLQKLTGSKKLTIKEREDLTGLLNQLNDYLVNKDEWWNR